MVGKAEDMARHRSGRLRITRTGPGDRHVLRVGAAVAVSVRAEAAAVIDGAEVGGPLRYTRAR